MFAKGDMDKKPAPAEEALEATITTQPELVPEPALEDVALAAGETEPDVSVGAEDLTGVEHIDEDDVAALEDIVIVPTEPCEEPSLAPKGDAALPVRFGSKQIKLKAPDEFPHIVELKDGETVVGYNIFLLGDIYYGRSESRPIQHFVQILDRAPEGLPVNIYINSRGGHIDAMAAMASSMVRTKALTTTIAVGAVMSAATVLWWAGKVRKVLTGAAFMYHFSSHGDYGHSLSIAKRAVALISYVHENLLKPMVDDGLLTDLEMSTILNGEDYFIPAQVVVARLEARAKEETDAQAAADAAAAAQVAAATASEVNPADQPLPAENVESTPVVEENANVE